VLKGQKRGQGRTIVERMLRIDSDVIRRMLDANPQFTLTWEGCPFRVDCRKIPGGVKLTFPNDLYEQKIRLTYVDMPCGGRRAYFDTGSHGAKFQFLYYGTASRDFVSRKWARVRYLSQALLERGRRELAAGRAREILGPVGDGDVKPPRLRTARWKFLKGKLQTLQAQGVYS
jgi:hypothetical protein